MKRAAGAAAEAAADDVLAEAGDTGESLSDDDQFDADLTQQIDNAFGTEGDDDELAGDGEENGDDDEEILIDDDEYDVDDDDDEEEEAAGADKTKPAAAAAADKAPAAAAAAADPAAAAKAGDAAAAPAAGTAAAAAVAAAAPAAGAAGAAAQAQWEPLQVRADKEVVGIDEARVSKANGHFFFVVPEAQAGRFMQRISRGVLYDKRSRELDQERRTLEAKKAAPQPKSDAEIEAELTYEALKPHLADILDERDIELLTAKIDLAKKNNRETFTKAEETRMQEASQQPWDEQQVEGLVGQMVELVKNDPALLVLSREELEDIYENEFLPIKNELVFRDNDGVFANTKLMHRLLTRAAKLKPPAATATASAPSQTPATADTSATPATDPASKTKADRAEAFNRGVNAAPRTTSLRANRNARPGTAAPRDAERGKRRRRNPQHEAEDKVRETQRAWLNSDSLDFDDGE